MILTLENHCSIQNSDIMAGILVKHLSRKIYIKLNYIRIKLNNFILEYLFKGKIDLENMTKLPRLSMFKNTIFIRVKILNN